jgi:hypothetical protein
MPLTEIRYPSMVRILLITLVDNKSTILYDDGLPAVMIRQKAVDMRSLLGASAW